MFISNKQLKTKQTNQKMEQSTKMGTCYMMVHICEDDSECKEDHFSCADLLEDFVEVPDKTVRASEILEKIYSNKFNENGLRNKIDDFPDILDNNYAYIFPASESQARLLLRNVDLLRLENVTHVCITILS